MASANKFRFSQRSEDNLVGVVPELARVATLALWYESEIDFSITCGLRDPREQAKLFEQGKTKTMASRHLTGQAIDIMAWIGNGPQSEDAWSPVYYGWIAGAFVRTIKNLQKYDPNWDDSNKIIWGGLWEMPNGGNAYLNNLDVYTAGKMLTLSNEYRDAKKAKGYVPFMDYVHFELRRL